MATEDPTTPTGGRTSADQLRLTTSDVRALADRLQARATSALLRDAPSQSSDTMLASALILFLLAELQELRATVERIASGMPPDSAWGHALFDAIAENGAHHAGLVRVHFPGARS